MNKNLIILLIISLFYFKFIIGIKPITLSIDELNNSSNSSNSSNNNKTKYNNIKYQYFTQIVDHFNYLNNDTFQQRYFINSEYYDGKGPIFLFLGGESPLDKNEINTKLQIVNYTKQFNALLIGIEHRYYGESNIYSNLSTNNLKYLNTQQVLADIANFITWFKEENINKSKWVLFGASYSGSLSAWFKIKYPHLIDLVISSSAPIYPYVNYYQYLEVVSNSIIALLDNGDECVNKINQAVLDAEILVSQDINQFKEKFNLCDGFSSEKDISYFFLAYASVFSNAIQYFNLKTLSKSCSIMTNTSNTPIDNLASNWSYIYKGDCINVQYKSIIKQRKDLSIKNYNRVWMYQVCTEFGFFQTSDSLNQPFGSKFGLKFFLDMCSDSFEIKDMKPNDKSVISQFGGFNQRYESASKILYVNSDIDPWKKSSISPNHEYLNTYLIYNASHCSDYHPDFNNRPNNIRNAKKYIYNFIKDNL